MSIYTRTARFDAEGRALTEDELRVLAPSVFAVSAHPSRSDRFAPIPTIEVIRALADEGFHVVGAQQAAVVRLDDRRSFAKHLLRIRNLDKQLSVDDTVFEMLLKNANDGTCRYELLAALFRVRCLNSVVAFLQAFDELKVRHSGGNVVHKVIECTYEVLNHSEAALAAPADWGKIHLDTNERRALAHGAHVLRFGENSDVPYKPEQLLEAHRSDDRGTDLWSVFNVIQENVIRGGVRATGRDANNRFRRYRTREIKGIDQNVKLNKGLFQLAATTAERLKQAA